MRLHSGSLAMFFWFAGLSFIIVATVFASPAIDYRLVILGSVLPVTEMFFGGPWILHSLIAPVVAMGIVMMAFLGKRLKQRKWLGIPIGMFLYLFLDRAWTKASLFWWPLYGFEVKKVDLPTWENPILIAVLELIGVIAGVYGIVRYKIYQKQNKQLFLKKGRIQRQVMRSRKE